MNTDATKESIPDKEGINEYALRADCFVEGCIRKLTSELIRRADVSATISGGQFESKEISAIWDSTVSKLSSVCDDPQILQLPEEYENSFVECFLNYSNSDHRKALPYFLCSFLLNRASIKFYSNQATGDITPLMALFISGKDAAIHENDGQENSHNDSHIRSGARNFANNFSLRKWADVLEKRSIDKRNKAVQRCRAELFFSAAMLACSEYPDYPEEGLEFSDFLYAQHMGAEMGSFWLDYANRYMKQYHSDDVDKETIAEPRDEKEARDQLIEVAKVVFNGTVEMFQRRHDKRYYSKTPYIWEKIISKIFAPELTLLGSFSVIALYELVSADKYDVAQNLYDYLIKSYKEEDSQME